MTHTINPEQITFNCALFISIEPELFHYAPLSEKIYSGSSHSSGKGCYSFCLVLTVVSLNMLFGKVLKYTALAYSSPLL
jgi:hypothetical protein